jgi:hypothetical protein
MDIKVTKSMDLTFILDEEDMKNLKRINQYGEELIKTVPPFIYALSNVYFDMQSRPIDGISVITPTPTSDLFKIQISDDAYQKLEKEGEIGSRYWDAKIKIARKNVDIA